MRTFGVEEELLLVDANTGLPVPAAPGILARQSVVGAPWLEAEGQQEMLEVVGPACATVQQVADGVALGRSRADAAARGAGVRAIALATSPMAVVPHHSLSPRYDQMKQRYGITALRTLTCGLHVHVSVASAEEGVGALDRIREWLPIILALSGNSPFWDGTDTGYASYRHDVWGRWPCTGPNPVFGSEAGYLAHTAMLLGTGALIDAGMFYFDARLSNHHPTLEVRVADVCLRAEDTVTIAALCRGLVESAAQQWSQGIAPLNTDHRVLRLASWQAALGGVRATLVHPVTGAECSPSEAVAALLDYAGPGLAATGDFDRVQRGVLAILERGTGADWQREQFARRGRIEDVVHAACEQEPAPLAR